jgi:hypothetical protein
MLLPTLGRLTAVRGCCERKAGLRVGNRTLLPISCEAILRCRASKVLRRQPLTQMSHETFGVCAATFNDAGWPIGATKGWSLSFTQYPASLTLTVSYKRLCCSAQYFESSSWGMLVVVCTILNWQAGVLVTALLQPADRKHSLESFWALCLMYTCL